MFSFQFLSILLLIIFNQTLSVKIGKIAHLSIKSNSIIRQSSNINCTDCLCDCFSTSSLSCGGINCFPSNQSCQLIEQRPWILESDTSITMTSNKFFTMKENSSRLCSCYTVQKILDAYDKINSTDYTNLKDIPSIKYIPDDDSLIILTNSSIRKLSAKNLSIILRSLSPILEWPISILHNGSVIYIAFLRNQSINMFDLNLTLLQTSISWNNQVVIFGGMFLWNNRILIIDIYLSVIWSINNLTSNNITKFLNFSSSNIQNPVSLFIYQNQSLYISSRSQNLYLFNLTTLTLKSTIQLSVNVRMLFMRYDSNCERLWFGTENSTYVPILDLISNQMNIYRSNGMLSKYGVYSIDFNSQYTAIYADYVKGELHQISLPDINC